MPQTQPPLQKFPSFKKLTVRRETSTAGSTASGGDEYEKADEVAGVPASAADIQVSTTSINDEGQSPSLIGEFAGRDTIERVPKSVPAVHREGKGDTGLSKDKQKLLRKLSKEPSHESRPDDYDVARDVAESDALTKGQSIHVTDFNKRIAEQQSHQDAEVTDPQSSSDDEPEDKIPSVISPPAKPSAGVVQNAFDRMRPKRPAVEVAEVTVGDRTMTMALGPIVSKRQKFVKSPLPSPAPKTPAMLRFSSSMQSFSAPGTQLEHSDGDQSQAPAGEYSDDEEAARRTQPLLQKEERPSCLRQHPELYTPASDDNDESGLSESPEDDARSEEEYLDDTDKKAKEDARVAALIEQAEEAAALPSQENVRRANNILGGGGQKETTIFLLQMVGKSIERIDRQLQNLEESLAPSYPVTAQPQLSTLLEASPEERLSLTVSKADFARMSIIGQFNLGFILAVRPSHSSTTSDELFIIDQHASDEKSNFERLQATTIVQNQRLVHPHQLDLTAIEEEIILENNPALLKNGFVVDMDTSGDSPVGQRCKLVSLPMSREVTFGTRDLEELIALLAETGQSTGEYVPRTSKVRKMFAMRACRSSVMVGKSLSGKQMERLVRRMGEVDKPWNCPHGRPTMRHLLGLGEWQGWREGDSGGDIYASREVDWSGWMGRMRGTGDAGQFQQNFEEEQELLENDEEGEDIELGEENGDSEREEEADSNDDGEANEQDEEEGHEVEASLIYTLRSRFSHDG